MPTLFTVFGFRFMFYSNDHEPIHIHVLKGGANWLSRLWLRIRRRLSQIGKTFLINKCWIFKKYG